MGVAIQLSEFGVEADLEADEDSYNVVTGYQITNMKTKLLYKCASASKFCFNTVFTWLNRCPVKDKQDIESHLCGSHFYFVSYLSL